MAWWNNNWDMVSAIAAWVTAVAIIIGFIIACWQIKELKHSRHVELCTYFCDNFENINKDRTVVKFREFLDAISFIDECKKECIYKGKARMRSRYPKKSQKKSCTIIWENFQKTIR